MTTNEELTEETIQARRLVRDILRRHDHESALQLTREEIASVSEDEQEQVRELRELRASSRWVMCDELLAWLATQGASTATLRTLRLECSTVDLTELLTGHEVSDARRETLTLAAQAGAPRTVLEALRDALRVCRRETIVLPRHPLEGLSRGRGWARKGRGDSAQWGERTDSGYRVGPGRWTVHGDDGFRRKRSDVWDVAHVRVGDQTWTVAS